MRGDRFPWLALAVGLLAGGVAAQPAAAQVPATGAPGEELERVDYGDPASWLCLPGRQDACAMDQAATVILEDGTMRREEWRPDPDAPVDCFYVYPTVSQEQSPNSSITAGPGERNVAHRQLARFGSRCRTFAPLYRQITLLALRAATAGQPLAADREMAYRDVVDAWNHYLAHDNDGRGVVLIGHSQGSGVLRRLVQEEIEGKPIESRIVSALLLGMNILVPAGRDVGGDFQHMPLCRSRDQTRCVVAYVSFRETVPPPEDARFGRTEQQGMLVACTHPAALAGGRAELDAYLNSERPGLPPWVEEGEPVTTSFVRVPGLLSGECVVDGHGSYLSVRIHGADSPRTDRIGGDVAAAGGGINASWGLHLIDVALAMGDLLELVGAQTEAYLAGARR